MPGMTGLRYSVALGTQHPTEAGALLQAPATMEPAQAPLTVQEPLMPEEVVQLEQLLAHIETQGVRFRR